MRINYADRIFGLDVLRALAILMVLSSHSTILLFPNKEHFLLTVIQFFGTVGVDLFFVLSGYLIGGIILKQLKDGRTKFKDFQYFWVRRWFRTLPNYFLVLVLNIILLFLLHRDITDGIWSYFIFLQNFSEPHPDFFTEAWSLSIEEYTYIIGPLGIYLVGLLLPKVSKLSLFLGITLVIICICNGFRLHFNNNTVLESMHEWSQGLRKVVVYRLDAIYYGFTAAYLISRYSIILRYARLCFFFGLGLFFSIHILIFIVGLSPQESSSFYNLAYLPLLAISLLLLFPLFVNWKNGGILRTIITKISILSYGLYLLNYSLILLTLQYFVDMTPLGGFQKGLMLLFYWSISFGASYLLYRYFEKPIMDLRDLKTLKSRFDQ